ncbi:hypothetical protein, partial [Enterococcus faecium]|uniref:hypothetical protein n=1 Tax=Enterococcus faecium TaxID=1352 RepID=UPI0019D6E7FB
RLLVKVYIGKEKGRKSLSVGKRRENPPLLLKSKITFWETDMGTFSNSEDFLKKFFLEMKYYNSNE